MQRLPSSGRNICKGMNVKFKIARLCEVCDFQGGSQPPKEEWAKEPKPNYVRMLQIRDFTQSSTEYIEYVKQSKSLKYCSEDDVLIGRYGASVGKILSGLSGAYNVAIIKSIPNESLVSKAFIKSYFLSSYFQHNLAVVSQHRAAQAGFSKEDIAEFHIPLPSLDEQERIVAELDLLTGIIDKQKSQLKELDNLAQSIFYDMFGDPEDNEKGWKCLRLGDLCNSDLGKTLNQAKDTGELRPYLCAINIKWQQIDLLTLKNARFEKDEIERYSVTKGDLLVCEGGDIGRSAIWDKDYDIQYQNALHRLRFTGKITAQYCLFTLQCLKQKGVLDSKYGNGVTIKHLVKSSLLSIPIPVPPITLQESFAQKIQSIESQKAAINRSIAETQKLFDYTMDKYFG